MLIYNRECAINVLGNICNDLNLVRDRNYNLNQGDFDDIFHKQLFCAIQNLALEKDITSVDGYTLATYMKSFPIQFERFKQANGIEFIENISKVATSTSFDYSYKMLKKFSILRRFHCVGMDIREIYNPDSLDVQALEYQLSNLERASIEDIKKHFKNKMIEVESEFQTNGDNYSFKGGDGLEELIQRCKNNENWGVTFQSKYLNAIFGGMQTSKLLIRSAGTGGGKL